MNHPDNHANDNANLDEIVENYNAPLWKYVKKLEKKWEIEEEEILNFNAIIVKKLIKDHTLGSSFIC